MSSERPTLEEQFPKMFNDESVASFNKRQDNPFNLPEGFYRVIGRSGGSLGLGHYCPACKLHTPLADATVGVRHCRRVDKLPEGFIAQRIFWFRLKDFKLSRGRY
jgi:hypothetical protein